MEDVYDSADITMSSIKKQELNSIDIPSSTNDFYKIPNPELTLYVFPHFAGKDEVPIPGYETVFNAYDHEYYEIKRNS